MTSLNQILLKKFHLAQSAAAVVVLLALNHHILFDLLSRAACLPLLPIHTQCSLASLQPACRVPLTLPPDGK
ncbi:Hypothetical predicted protein [Cloeon dipterum]|uniref:Uncharacterized protein n=1 Tax=Cloeon dipterum TaxID=197152 RepID=A0A8S1C0V7_9INSE|nr:Hypothetical predicted protein [Cloeon dipterum]